MACPEPPTPQLASKPPQQVHWPEHLHHLTHWAFVPNPPTWRRPVHDSRRTVPSIPFCGTPWCERADAPQDLAAGTRKVPLARF